MAFEGEIALGALNSKYKYGFTIGDIYRVQGAGNLVPNNLAVANGAFVEWKSTGWEVKKDMQYAVSKTGESLDQAVADVLDDHSTAPVEEEVTVPTAEAANYTVDNYFEQDGEIWKCTAKTDNGDDTWTIEADKVNGVIPVLNELVNSGNFIKSMTLRFMFSDADYNPQAAGVGTSGTWTKKINTNYNVWDWTNNNADWSYAFQDAFQDASNNVDIIDCGNTNCVTNLVRFLSGCTSLKSIVSFDTSEVTNMASMFNGCTGLVNIPLFNTSKVTAMNSMLNNCSSLVAIPLFDTSRNSGFANFAQGCSSLKKVPLLNTSVTTGAANMFNGCLKVEEGTLSLYTQMSGQANPPSSHAGCFTNCGRDTVTGAAELAQIPSSWGGTGT